MTGTNKEYSKKLNMEDIVKQIADGVNDLYTNPQQLAAIWLPKKVKVNDVLAYRITDGDLVTIKDGKLVNEGDNTHVITTCWGTLADKFCISVAELGTLELSQIKL